MGPAGTLMSRPLNFMIELGAVDGGTFSEVVAEGGGGGMPGDFAALDARGHLFYTGRVPGGAATFRTEAAKGGSAPVARDLVMAIPSPDGAFVIGSHMERGLMRVNSDGS